MLAAIKHGLNNLVNFNGRDARQAFWYYVLFIYIVTIVITMVVVVPMIVQAIAASVQAGMAAGQAGADPVAAQMQVQNAMMHSMTGMMSNMMTVSMITNVLMLAALASAFVRRLHDSDLSGLWGLIPAAIQVLNLFLAPALMRRMMSTIGEMPTGADPEANMRAMQASMSTMQGSMGAASAAGWLAIIIVIVLGVRKSTGGPNRYGETTFIT